MSKQLLKTLVVMAVLLLLVAVPAMAQTQNGPLIATRQGDGQIEKIDPTTGEITPIPGAIKDSIQRSAPSVTPDGNTVVYAGEVDGNTELFSVPIDGSAAPTQLTSTVSEPTSSFKRDPVVSPDGETVYFNWDRYDSDFTILQGGLYSVSIGGGEPTPIVEDSEDAALRFGMKLTPDGQSIAYNLWSTQPENPGIRYEEIRSVPATGGTPTVIVPFGTEDLHEDLLWAPQAVPSVVPEVVPPTVPINGATGVTKTIEPKAEFNTDLIASTVTAGPIYCGSPFSAFPRRF